MKYLRLLLISGFLITLQITLVPSVDMALIGLVLVVFFLDEHSGITYALISGIVRDFFFPIFGFHFALYGIESFIGIFLIHTIITHRSFLGFTGITWSILLANVLLTPLLLFAISTLSRTYEFLAPSWSDTLESAVSSFIIYSVASIGYIILSRMYYTQRYGMTIERV